MSTEPAKKRRRTAGKSSLDDHGVQLGLLGEFTKNQRRLAQLSQRELAKLTNLSDPYVSQIERGLHAPSIKVLRALAAALDISAETMLAYAGLLDPPAPKGATVDTEVAIRNDERLDDAQKHALLGVYRSFIAAAGEPEHGPDNREAEARENKEASRVLHGLRIPRTRGGASPDSWGSRSAGLPSPRIQARRSR